MRQQQYQRLIETIVLVLSVFIAWYIAHTLGHLIGGVYGYEKTTTNSYTVRVTKRVVSPHIIRETPTLKHGKSEAARSVVEDTTLTSHKLGTKSDQEKTDQAGGVISDEQIKEYIRSKDWDDSIAIRIAKSENAWNLTHSFDCARVGYNNDSVGSRDRGIFQINDYWHPHFSDAQAFDCFQNIDYAYEIYKSRGNWSAWYAYSNGSYLNHTDL